MKNVCALMLSGLIGTSALLAADAPATATPPPARATPGNPILQGQPTPAAPPKREQLSDELRQKIRAASEKYRDEQKALYEKLRAARADLEKTAQAPTLDEKAIREKASVVGQLEGDLAILRARQYHDLQAILPNRTNAFARPNPATNTGHRLQEIRRRPAISPLQDNSITPLERK